MSHDQVPEIERQRGRGRPTPSASPVAGPAVREEDYVWAETEAHFRRVEHALSVLRRAREIGPIGVSFSGGKDSTCLLDLARLVDPETPGALYDSGAELSSSLDLARALGVEVITPRLSMRELAHYAGWWGYVDPTDAGCGFDAKRILIEEPAEVFVVRRRLRVLAYGLRAGESYGRTALHRSRGELWKRPDRTWMCMPLATWEPRDVWAYIAGHGLAYNPAYDRMAAARVTREEQRVSGLLGGRGVGHGRYSLLRMAEPALWRELVAEFPGIARLS